jgi:hypothetical protein
MDEPSPLKGCGNVSAKHTLKRVKNQGHKRRKDPLLDLPLINLNREKHLHRVPRHNSIINKGRGNPLHRVQNLWRVRSIVKPLPRSMQN